VAGDLDVTIPIHRTTPPLHKLHPTIYPSTGGRGRVIIIIRAPGRPALLVNARSTPHAPASRFRRRSRQQAVTLLRRSAVTTGYFGQAKPGRRRRLREEAEPPRTQAT
jgi:hypothetical protein